MLGELGQVKKLSNIQSIWHIL